MPKTLQVSDATFEFISRLRDATELKSDTLIRYGLMALFPRLGPGMPAGKAEILQDLAEFLDSHVPPDGEWDGWKRSPSEKVSR